jgi:hypothetical protein
VYPGGPFATIGAAQAKAIADGHTDSGNSAVVLISPKAGGWNEDIILTAGVHIQGIWGNDEYSILVNGKISFTPAVGLFHQVHVEGLYLQAPAGKPCVELLGANVGQLYVRNCVVTKAENTAPNVLINGNAGSTLFLQDCIGNLAAGGTAYDIESGTLQAVTCDLSAAAAARGLKIGAAGLAKFFNVNLVARGPDVVNVASGGAYQFDNVLITQGTAGNSGIIQAGIPPFPTGLLIYCFFNVPLGAGYAAKGTGVLSHASNVFATNAKFQSPGLVLNPLAILPVPTP